MSWPTREQWESRREAVRSMPPRQASALTWERAAELVPPDTLALAEWVGLRESGKATPYRALCRVLRVEPT